MGRKLDVMQDENVYQFGETYGYGTVKPRNIIRPNLASEGSR